MLLSIQIIQTNSFSTGDVRQSSFQKEFPNQLRHDVPCGKRRCEPLEGSSWVGRSRAVAPFRGNRPRDRFPSPFSSPQPLKRRRAASKSEEFHAVANGVDSVTERNATSSTFRTKLPANETTDARPARPYVCVTSLKRTRCVESDSEAPAPRKFKADRSVFDYYSHA